MKIDSLVEILNSDNIDDINFGQNLIKCLNLSRRKKQVLIQKLIESRKWTMGLICLI